MIELPAGDVPQWTLGDRMRKAREYAGLKQSELAAEVGIGRTSVVGYESGRKSPPRPVLLSWALLCRVDFKWLMGEDGYRPRRANVANRDISDLRKLGFSAFDLGLAA